MLTLFRNAEKDIYFSVYHAMYPNSSSSAAERRANASSAADPGVAVVLPNGSAVPDKYSPTGKLMSPTANLSAVAAAGKEAGGMYRALLNSAEGAGTANLFLFGSLAGAVGQGGAYDYQRSGNWISGFRQLRQFRDVSNFNVGLFSQQAGLTLKETLTIAGFYARAKSSNASPSRPYGLDPRTAAFIIQGYNAGANAGF